VDAIETIYKQLASVLGGTDPNQFVTLQIPGTILDQSSYAYDTTTRKPPTVVKAESELVDQMFDLAQVSASSNGQRVSDQYLQALSVLVPRFDAEMPELKTRLRDYLNQPAPANASIDGTPFVGTLGAYYFALDEAWLLVKSAWEQEVITNRENKNPDDFLDWYEGIAEGRLALIDAAEGRLLSVFAPSDMNAILGALASGPAGAIEEAVDQVLDLRVPSPDGGYIYPVELIPDNWFLDLASDIDPVNLLADPQFIALTIGARRSAIQASIGQIQSLLSQLPTSGDLAAAAAALKTAQTSYTSALNDLLNTYAANTVTAVEMYLAAESGGATETLADLNADAAAVSKAAKDPVAAVGATLKTGVPLSADDFDKLLAGQKALSNAQAALVSGAQGLADAGMNLASEEAQNFGGLPVMLSRLQSQLSDLTALQEQLGTSVGAASQPTPQPVRIAPDKLIGEAQTIATAAQQSAGGTPLQLVKQLYTTIDAIAEPDQTSLTPIFDAATVAWTTAVATTVVGGADELEGLATQVAQAATEAAKPSTATGADVLAAVTGVLPQGGKHPAINALKFIWTAANAVVNPSSTSEASAKKVAPAANAATADQVLDATTGAVATVRAALGTAVTTAQAIPSATTPPVFQSPTTTTDPVTDALTALTDSTECIAYLITLSTAAGRSADTTATAEQAAIAVAASFQTDTPTAVPAATSDRWMELQFSFSSSEMSNQKVSLSSSSQTSWSVDLFFGSASGSTQSSAAKNSQEMFSQDTAVQIGLKATKVVIERGWFNPGLFKLSKDMDRISTVPIAGGPVDPGDSTLIVGANEAILPCFPVAFLVVKDVTIQFQADSSHLDAVQSVLDSRSAVGGGFLCFSASSASAAHSDSSSVHSKTQDTVITITMPGPQILGWILEFTPTDGSRLMTDETPRSNADLNILQFVQALERLTKRHKAETPDEGNPA
jgi:hypothetical protein